MPVFSTGFDWNPTPDDDSGASLKDGVREYKPDLVSRVRDMSHRDRYNESGRRELNRESHKSSLLYDGIFGILIIGLFGVILAY